jgi:hypothetical protein
MSDIYINYYLHQAEGRNYGGLYRGNSQKGDGLGSYLGGLFRRILPLFASGAKSLGSEVATTGISLLKDLIGGRKMKDAVRERLSQAGHNLTDKVANKVSSMVGSGYKKRKRRRKSQSVTTRKRRRVNSNKRSVKKRKTKRNNDIFG